MFSAKCRNLEGNPSNNAACISRIVLPTESNLNTAALPGAKEAVGREAEKHHYVSFEPENLGIKAVLMTSLGSVAGTAGILFGFVGQSISSGWAALLCTASVPCILYGVKCIREANRIESDAFNGR